MHDEDPGATHLPDCNFTSRIRCVNRFVIDYISDDHTLGTVFSTQMSFKLNSILEIKE